MDNGLSLEAYRREALKAARELFYGDEVICEIEKATNTLRIDAILSRARCNMKPAFQAKQQKAACKVAGKKLDSEQVAEIRAYYAETGGARGTVKELAAKYGVDRYTIYKIINNIDWK